MVQLRGCWPELNIGSYFGRWCGQIGDCTLFLCSLISFCILETAFYFSPVTLMLETASRHTHSFKFSWDTLSNAALTS